MDDDEKIVRGRQNWGRRILPLACCWRVVTEMWEDLGEEHYPDLDGARAASSASDCGVTVSQEPTCQPCSGRAVQNLGWCAGSLWTGVTVGRALRQGGRGRRRWLTRRAAMSSSSRLPFTQSKQQHQHRRHRANYEEKAISIAFCSCIASDSMRAIWEGGVGWVEVDHGEPWGALWGARDGGERGMLGLDGWDE